MYKTQQHSIENRPPMRKTGPGLQWITGSSAGNSADAAALVQRNGRVNCGHAAGARAGQIARSLGLLLEQLPVRRRLVHAGDLVFEAGMPFNQLYVINSGSVKVVNTAADGRNQVVGLLLRGDWLGFDGIAKGQYGCTAQALEVGEVWALRYDELLRAASSHPQLLIELHTEMSRAITRGRDAMLSVCTLPVAARVAEFLRQWAESLAVRGLRNDQIILRMSRAEIGNYLGMTLESVSRALSSLERAKVICFTERGRRLLHIPDPQALSDFIQAEGQAAGATLQ
ncbi:Crp/Fnr family transcriptional regulator [Paucibacter sp. B2R-40]|uniref:Crp/Fnr family transcriptional regulator n=1 Tax=Paucibacter sp. B2R-40 TaxID=2893554 RepID=UPI0021E4CA40|nr:Crp/Fnr family transcriptional regulator [Paucibacter sp. B2R-40]MCV2356487.1 Crp/Fnr family transcriptional regulator [Paucibacter sp. B2R-40]